MHSSRKHTHTQPYIHTNELDVSCNRTAYYDDEKIFASYGVFDNLKLFVSYEIGTDTGRY